MLPWHPEYLGNCCFFYGMFARTFMEHGEKNRFFGDGSALVGAIFMSNRMTKKECISRKLFGLPSSQEGFVKKVKAGMILFLFEHEERKLYGVYEATSDGAMNIVPNAYSSSGYQFPAQIRFKVIWLCKPLSEDEFGDAIKENYYMHNKFNFGLSYEQVCNLMQLFYSKKSFQRYQSPGSRVKVTRRFENSGSVKSRLTEKDQSLKFDTIEGNTDHNLDSRYPGSSGLDIDYSMYYKNRDQIFEGRMIHQPFEPPSNLIHSTSRSDRSLRGNFPTSPSRGPRYFTDTSLGGQQSSTALGADDQSLALKRTASSRYSVDDQGPPFRSQSYPSQSDPTVKLPPPSYLNLHGSSSIEGLSDPLYDPSEARSPFIDTKGYSNFLSPRNMSCPECNDAYTSQIYPPTQEMYVPKGTKNIPTEHIPPMPRLNFSYDLPDASQSQAGSRGERYWRQEPPPDYIPLSEDENLVRSMEPSHSQRFPQDQLDMPSSQSQDDNDYERMRAYHLKHSFEDHPTITNASLYSDTYRRTSVFNRLSGKSNVRQLEDEAYDPDTTPALDQVLELLNQRINQWTKRTDVPKKFIAKCDEQLENESEMEVDHIADSNIELNPHYEVMSEESFEPPFVNFKRRSEVQKVDGETETGGYAECSKGKQKMRRLVRPSFSDEDASSKANKECHNMQASLRAIGGAQTLIQDEEGKRRAEIIGSSVRCDDDNGNKSDMSLEASLGNAEVISTKESKRSAEIIESSVRCDDDNGNKSYMSLEASLGNAEVMDTENNVEGPKDCGICTAQILPEEPGIRQTPVIHVQGTGAVEILTLSQSGLADEKVLTLQDNETAAQSIDRLQAPNLQGSGKTKLSEVSKEDSICQVIGECGGNNCDGIGEKEVITTSDGNAEKCLSTVGDLKEVVEMSVESSHLVDDETTAMLVHDICEVKDSDGSGEKNVTMYDGDRENYPLESDVNNGQVLPTAYTGSDGKDERSLHMVSDKDSILSADIKSEGKEVGDECGGKNLIGIEEKEMIVSGEIGESSAREIQIDCANASSSSGNLNGSLALLVPGRWEGKNSNEADGENVRIIGGRAQKVSFNSSVEDEGHELSTEKPEAGGRKEVNTSCVVSSDVAVLPAGIKCEGNI